MTAGLALESLALLASGGLATSLVQAWVNARKLRAEADKERKEGRSVEIRGELQIVEVATNLAQELRSDISRLRADVDTLIERNRQLQTEVDELLRENTALRAENGAFRAEILSLRAEVKTLRENQRDRKERFEHGDIEEG